MKITSAGRLEIIIDLFNPEIVDEEGNVIGYGEPLITESEARDLLEMQESDESSDDRP